MSHSHSRRRVLLGTGALGATALAGCLTGSDASDWEVDETLPVSTATQYNAPNCACCTEYATYLEGHLDGDLDAHEPDDITAVKRGHGVPAELESCHTVVLGDYVVEGHVPVEAILPLFEEEPDLAGIALPEMPAGSPGMGGEKDEPWTVYGFDAEGQYEPVREL